MISEFDTKGGNPFLTEVKKMFVVIHDGKETKVENLKEALKLVFKKDGKFIIRGQK